MIKRSCFLEVSRVGGRQSHKRNSVTSKKSRRKMAAESPMLNMPSLLSPLFNSEKTGIVAIVTKQPFLINEPNLHFAFMAPLIDAL